MRFWGWTWIFFGLSLGFQHSSHSQSRYLSLEGAATTTESRSLESRLHWSFLPLFPVFAEARVWLHSSPDFSPKTADRNVFIAGVAWDRFTLLGRSESLSSSSPFFRGVPIVQYKAAGVELRFHFYDRGKLELPEPNEKDLDLQLPTIGTRIEWTSLSSQSEEAKGITDDTNRFTQYALLRIQGKVLLIPKIDLNTSNYRYEISSGTFPTYTGPHLRLVRLGPDEHVSGVAGVFSESHELFAKWKATPSLEVFAAFTHVGLVSPERDAWTGWVGTNARSTGVKRLFWSPSIEVYRQLGQLNAQVSLELKWSWDPKDL